ncbi:hypothetical protein GCK32_012783 [Trichostrongylus colubriformis]|uniref:Uncharacterized protein n=1 Tax=Trichostrongylus colubriformis TaxID=6319 RepID=A0AAN8FXN4_TRICO
MSDEHLTLTVKSLKWPYCVSLILSSIRSSLPLADTPICQYNEEMDTVVCTISTQFYASVCGMKNNSKYTPRVSEKKPLAKRSLPSVGSNQGGGNPNFEEASFSEFTPAAPKPSQYLMDQIKLEKPSREEIVEALKQENKASGEEPLKPLGPSPSEYQLASLNDELSRVPMVVAFNEKEKRKAHS